MNPSIRALYGRRQYFIAFTLFLLITLIYWSFYSKADCFILLNGKHAALMESFFAWYTLLGDGVVVVAICIMLLVRRSYLQTIHLFTAYIMSGLLAQLIKYFFHMPRPKVFFQEAQYNQFIEGVTRGGWSSFPSGHTTTAFAIATILVFYTSNRWLQMAYLCLAIVVGYSRIYLGSHFLEDVQAGSIIGVFVAAAVYTSMPELRLFGRRFAAPDRVNAIVVQ